jgi:hypothetical protein
MPSLSRPNVAVWKLRFRRKYLSNPAALETLSDEVAGEAGEMVTFTSHSEDGSSAGAVVTGNKLEMLAAIEELLDDSRFMSGIAEQRSRVWAPDFSQSTPV